MLDGTVYINVCNRHLIPIPTPIPITTILTPIPTPPKRTTNDSDSDSGIGVGIVAPGLVVMRTELGTAQTQRLANQRLFSPLRAVVESRLANQRLRCTAAGGESMAVCLLRAQILFTRGTHDSTSIADRCSRKQCVFQHSISGDT